jgi:hypothetical protein
VSSRSDSLRVELFILVTAVSTVAVAWAVILRLDLCEGCLLVLGPDWFPAYPSDCLVSACLWLTLLQIVWEYSMWTEWWERYPSIQEFRHVSSNI